MDAQDIKEIDNVCLFGELEPFNAEYITVQGLLSGLKENLGLAYRVYEQHKTTYDNLFAVMGYLVMVDNDTRPFPEVWAWPKIGVIRCRPISIEAVVLGQEVEKWKRTLVEKRKAEKEVSSSDALRAATAGMQERSQQRFYQAGSSPTGKRAKAREKAQKRLEERNERKEEPKKSEPK